MIKYNLLTTSALIFGGLITGTSAQSVHPESLLQDGAIPIRSFNGAPVVVMFPSAHGGQGFQSFAPVKDNSATFSNLSKDGNAEFLSWYGYQTYAYSYHSCSSSHCLQDSGYQEVAIPITGAGKAVKSIKVPNAGGKFTVVLYTNGDNNKPDNPISGASGTGTGASSEYCCAQLVTVKIHETTLSAGTTYWIVEKSAAVKNSENKVTWLGEDTDFTGDGKYLVNRHSFYKNSGVTRSNYTSGWEASCSPKCLSEPAAEAK